ncbi:glucose PTS transporter subunit IIA [Bifidobacterium simiarum]|nr:glucose PTS transporter subunit IIA [Bifidobacterium simiarum]
MRAEDRRAAAAIVAALGGADNIRSVTHCATRLRFVLRDAGRVDQRTLDDDPAVLGAVPQYGDRYQVVIGAAVEDVYDAMMIIPGVSGEGTGRSDYDGRADYAGRADRSGRSVRADRPAQTNRSDISDAADADDTANTSDAADPSARSRLLTRGAVAETATRAVNWFFEYLSDSFRPIIGVLLGASIVIALVNMLIAVGVIPDDEASAGWVFVKTMWKGVFYFLPIIVAYNASKKLKVDPWLGSMIMAALMTPQFTGLMAAPTARCVMDPTLGTRSCTIDVFGLPMQLNDYSGNVFVPLIMVLALGATYHGLKAVLPRSVRIVFLPFLSMVLITPLTAFVLGPFGVWLSRGIGVSLAWQSTHAPVLFAIMLPLIYPFMVPIGLHWPLNALMIVNVQMLGYDFIQGPMAVWNFACFGSTAGVLFLAVREHDDAMRRTATGALLAGLLGGLTEPSLYGIHLRYRLIYRRMLAGCAVGGVTIALLGALFPATASDGTVVHGVIASSFAFTSLLTIPLFSRMGVYAASIAVAFVVPMILIIAMDYRPRHAGSEPCGDHADDTDHVDGRDKSGENHAGSQSAADRAIGENPNKSGENRPDAPAETDAGTTAVRSPIAGRTVPLERSGDPVFASRALGDGVGILPDERSGRTEVLAPVSGVVKTVAGTGHAFGIRTDDGVEVLIHIGIDTVRMEGEGFSMVVSKGEHVDAGDPLGTVDFAAIRHAGCDAMTMMTVTNTAKMTAVAPIVGVAVDAGDPVIAIER